MSECDFSKRLNLNVQCDFSTMEQEFNYERERERENVKNLIKMG